MFLVSTVQCAVLVQVSVVGWVWVFVLDSVQATVEAYEVVFVCGVVLEEWSQLQKIFCVHFVLVKVRISTKAWLHSTLLVAFYF